MDELEAYPGRCRTARRRWRPDVDRRATGLEREMTEQVTSSGKADVFRQNAITNQEMSLLSPIHAGESRRRGMKEAPRIWIGAEGRGW